MRARIAVPAAVLAGAAVLPWPAAWASPVCATFAARVTPLPAQGLGPLCVAYDDEVSCREEGVEVQNPDLLEVTVSTCLPKP